MVIKSDHLPQPGETVLGRNFLMNQGGKGANQAIAAARLGGNTLFICNIGNDQFGHDAKNIFQKEGIDTRYVNEIADQHSGIALINVNSEGENTIVVAPGANGTLSIDDIKKAEDEIKKASIVLMQLETPVEALVYAAKIAKESGVKVILNPAPAPSKALPDELLKNVDILIPNVTEAEIIAKMKINNKSSMNEAMHRILSKGISTVIITMGADGALAYEGGELFQVPAYKVKAVDTTAAGDTFCGALCVALDKGEKLKDAIRFANKASSISVTRMGAQVSIPYANEIKL
jgi:ribokinase